VVDDDGEGAEDSGGDEYSGAVAPVELSSPLLSV
jgi:hypothetical protein